MIKEDLYLIVGAVFIKEDKATPNTGSKYALANEIIKKFPSRSNKISSKTLVNYYNYFLLNQGKNQNPDNDTLLLLINYWSSNSFISFSEAKKYFEKNKPSKDLVDKNIPLFKNNENKEEIKGKEKIDNEKIIKNFIFNSSTREVEYNNQFRLSYLIILAVVAISISSFYFFNQKGNTNIDLGGVEINNDFRQIYPTKDTQFFSKENNQPLIWYTNYNDQLDFFNAKGTHPISGKQLKPITKEVVRTYFLKKLPVKNEVKNKNATKNQKPTSKETLKSNSIFNQSIRNSSGKDISLFIFDSIQQIDIYFSNHLKKEFAAKKYKITPTLILSSKLNKEVIEHLLVNNFTYFNEDIKKYTDYVCVGKIHYSFNKSNINQELITCKLQIEYTITDVNSGEIINTYSNLVIGTGFSKVTAKNNTIKKFKL